MRLQEPEHNQCGNVTRMGCECVRGGSSAGNGVGSRYEEEEAFHESLKKKNLPREEMQCNVSALAS